MAADPLASLTDLVPAAELLPALLDLSVAGVVYYLPVRDAAGEVVDFTFHYLNPAAQRLLGLPARPTATYRQQFPGSEESGAWERHREALLTDEPTPLKLAYRLAGQATYCQASLRRLGAGLLASFTLTTEQDADEVGRVLRDRQADERAALAQARASLGLLQTVFTQAPVALGLFQGPDLTVALANAQLCATWGYAPGQVLGRPLLDAVPELRGQGFDLLLADVARTGEPFVGTEVPAELRQPDGQVETRYFNFVYQPLRDETGALLGVLDIAVDTTPQVLAQQQLQALNLELEERVAERTAQLEVALREAERQRTHAQQQQLLLGRILAQVPAAIATMGGPEHRFSFFNEPYQRLAAGRAGLGLSVAEVFPEVVEQGFIKLLDGVLASGEPFVGSETPALLHDAATGRPEQVYVNFVYQPLTDGQGRPQGVLAFIVDVSEQVRARQQAADLQAELLGAARRQAQQRQDLYQIFEQAPAAIVLLREPDHRIEYLNPAYARLFPSVAVPGSLLGCTIAAAYPESATNGIVARLDRVYQSGEPYAGIEEGIDLIYPDGSAAGRGYFNFTYQAYREQGRIAGVAAFIYDVSEQARLRQQRDAHQADLQRLFEQAPVAIAVLRGPQYVIELANPAVCALWGRSAEQALGTPLFELLPEVAGQGFEALLDGVLASGEPFVAHELPSDLDRHGRRETVYWDFVYQPLPAADGQVSGVLIVATDVTEQVLARRQVQALNDSLQAANQELHHTNTRLRRTNAELDSFVYAASHDLKAPIANIEGLLHALHQELPAALTGAGVVGRVLGLMGQSVSRFQQTIGHLASITQVQHAAPDAASAVDLAQLIDDVRLDLQPAIEASGARLTVETDDCHAVHFAPQSLRSIVYNLLSNALKYRAPDRAPAVVLRAACAGPLLRLSVQDNGLGLTPEQQGKLFRLFQRLHPHVEGSGVGLYTIRKMVEAAGGTIGVESQPGVGTTFTVILPV